MDFLHLFSISKSSSSRTNRLVTVPSVIITAGTTVTIIVFLILLQDLGIYLSFHFPSVLPHGQPERQSPLFGRFYFLFIYLFFLTINRSGRLTEIGRHVCISKSQRIFCVSFSRTDSGLSIYQFFVWSNFNFLHYSLWITLPTQSCLL